MRFQMCERQRIGGCRMKMPNKFEAIIGGPHPSRVSDPEHTAQQEMSYEI